MSDGDYTADNVVRSIERHVYRLLSTGLQVEILTSRLVMLRQGIIRSTDNTIEKCDFLKFVIHFQIM